jgi:hypothetical protein
MIYHIKNEIRKTKFEMRKKGGQEGVTLMLSVLILAAILAIAFSLATITFTEIRSSGDLLRTEPAFNAADAVAEEALFKVKRNVPDNLFTYSSSLNNVKLGNPVPTESFTSTPILQVVVPRYSNDFNSTRVRFPIYDTACIAPKTGGSQTCETGGSGYGRAQVTYLDTGNSDVLKVFLCEFDPRKPVDPSGQDSSSYSSVPCSNPTDTSNGYWKTLSGGDYLTNSDSNRTRTWTLDPYMQQELIFYNSGATADIHVEVRTFDQNYVAKGMPLVGQKAVDINASSAGVVRKIRTIIPLSGTSGSVVTETVWIEDQSSLTGAVATSDFPDNWGSAWVSSNPSPFSGSQAWQSGTSAGTHQLYFYSHPSPLSVIAGDKLFAYVYLDPTSPPSEVMLQWNDGDWEQRAYWGANSIGWGTDGTDSRRYMGPLPALGQWVRLEVPANQLGLEGKSVVGMAYTLFGGKATWDKAGKVSQ